MISIVFMVAGMSSRFGGKPKQLELVGPENETLIEYSVNQSLESNFTDIWFVTNFITEPKFKRIFQDNYRGKPVFYVQQNYDSNLRQRPWGTTDAICQLYQKINNPFILVNGDDIYGSKAFKTGFELLNRNINLNFMGVLPLIETLPDQGKVNRGVVYLDPSTNKICKIKEKLNITKQNIDPNDQYANINFIGLQPKILSYLNQILVKFKQDNPNDAKIECLLPNNLSSLIEENKLDLEYFEIEDSILGITNPGDELILKNKLLNISK